MQKKKSILQKSSLLFSVICFISALVCAVALFIKGGELGMDHPISASLAASIFFFFSVAAVLFVIGKSDIPSFKVNTDKGSNEDN